MCVIYSYTGSVFIDIKLMGNLCTTHNYRPCVSKLYITLKYNYRGKNQLASLHPQKHTRALDLKVLLKEFIFEFYQQI